MKITEHWNLPDRSAPNFDWIVGHAILAPSSHNAQPWIVKRRDDHSFDLYIDTDRLLGQVDPNARQTHISHGCFLEAASLAARQRGLDVSIDYFPEGEHDGSSLDERPVARLTAGADGEAPTPFEARLFEAIPERRTNKRTYDNEPIPEEASIQLHDAIVVSDNPSAMRLVLHDTPHIRNMLVEICTDAMAVEVSSPARNAELADWFRFSKSEVEEKRDGFSIEQSGTTGLTRWFVETFVLDRREATDPEGTFARQAIKMCKHQAASAPLFGAIVTENNSRETQLIAGRSYMRVQLLATSLGLASHPLSQPTEEYAEMDTSRRRMERVVGTLPRETVQMLFRLGYCDKSDPHAPRRPVESFVRP